jgi:hypothetical protein
LQDRSLTVTSHEQPQPSQPDAQAAAEPQTTTPNEPPQAREDEPAAQGQAQLPQAQEEEPAAQGQAQPPQPPPVLPPPPQAPPPPYPFAPIPKLPWIAPARKGVVIAIGIAAAVLMFGAGIGAGAAIFHNDQPSRPSVEYRLPGFGQRQFPEFPRQLPTPSPAPSATS